MDVQHKALLGTAHKKLCSVIAGLELIRENFQDTYQALSDVESNQAKASELVYQVETLNLVIDSLTSGEKELSQLV